MSQVVSSAKETNNRNDNNNSVEKPRSEQRGMSVEELVKERLRVQAALAKAYPDMPVMSLETINSFKDYAYAAHD